MSNHLKEIELRSEEVRDILTKVPPWLICWGSLLFLSLIVLILALAWFIKYPDIITSEAILTTEIPPQKEYARISGQLDTIYVEDKQSVQKNSVLAIVENTADHKDVYLLQSILDTLKIDRGNVSFPFEKLPILFLGDIEPDFAKFENSYFQYTLNQDLQPFSNEAMANKVSLAELQRRLQTLIEQRDINKNEIEFEQKDLERNKTLFQKGIISAQEYENKQLENLTAQRNYQNMGITISQLRESLANAKRISKGTDFNRTREEIQLLKTVIQSYNGLKKAVREWELKYVFKSNIKGKVSFLNYWNTNQTVNTGDLVFSILPETHSPFIAKLRTPSTNAGKIRIGQRVNLSLYDYPEYEFGVLQGEIKRISATSDHQGVYIVDVSIPKTLKTSFGKKIEFKQEMKGEADIVTEDLRLLERLFYQFREVFRR